MASTDVKPIELYSWSTPNGWKIEIALDELNLPYNYHGINIGAGDQFKEEFLRISPNNKIPALVDPNTDLSVFESGAILTYLAQHYRTRSTEQLLPSAESDPRGNAAVLQWLNWQMGGFGPMLGQYNHFFNYAPDKIEYAITRYRNEAKRLFGVLDKQLAATNAYVAGAHFSIADIAIWPWALMIPRFGEEFSTFKHVNEWIERLKQRPAVNKVWTKVSETISKPPTPFTDEQKKILFGIEAKK